MDGKHCSSHLIVPVDCRRDRGGELVINVGSLAHAQDEIAILRAGRSERPEGPDVCQRETGQGNAARLGSGEDMDMDIPGRR